MLVYTIQRVVQPVVNRFDNRFGNRLYNRIGNRLYRVNGVLSIVVYCILYLNCVVRGVLCIAIEL